MAEDLRPDSWHSPWDTENGMYWPSLLPMCSPPSLYLCPSLSVHTQLYDTYLDTAGFMDSSMSTAGHLSADSVAMILSH